MSDEFGPAPAPPAPPQLRPVTSDDDDNGPRRGVPLLPRGPMTANNAGNATPTPAGTPPQATANPAANNSIYSPANTNPALNNPAPPPPGAPRPPGTPPPAGGPAQGSPAAPSSPPPAGSDQPAGAHDPAKQPPFNPSQVLSAVTGAASPLLSTAVSLPTSLLGMGMGLLAPFSQILQQFGQGEPAMPSTDGMPPGVLNSLGSLDPSSGVTGNLGDKYASDVDDQSNKAQALDHLDKDLRKTLKASAANSKGGREKIEEIINQVNSSLQALGPAAGSPLGQAGVLSAITQGLQQAGAVLSQAVGNDALNANSVKALAGNYTQDLNNKDAHNAQLVDSIGDDRGTPGQMKSRILALGKEHGLTDTEIGLIMSVGKLESNFAGPGYMGFGPEAKAVGYNFDRSPLGAVDQFYRQYLDRKPAGLNVNSPEAVANYIWHTVHHAADPNYGSKLLNIYRGVKYV
jgi:hypothetical protein